MLTSRVAIALGLVVGAENIVAQAQPTTHVLMPTPTTVAWGYYDAAAPPVLHIR